MKNVDMKTMTWGGRKIVASRYSEFLLELEEHIDERDGMLIEVMGNSGIQKLVASGRKEHEESVTLLKACFLPRLLKFSLVTSFTLVQESELLKDVFSLADDNSVSSCVLSPNKNSALSKEVAQNTKGQGRVKQLFSDSNSIDEMLIFLMSKGIDVVLSNIEPSLAYELRQTCKKKHRKTFVWIQLTNQEKAVYQTDRSRLDRGGQWFKESAAKAACAWKVIRFKPLINQENR